MFWSFTEKDMKMRVKYDKNENKSKVCKIWIKKKTLC